MSIPKLPRAIAAATAGLAAVLATSALAVAPALPAPASAARTPAPPHPKVQPGGPITATAAQRTAVRAAFGAQPGGISNKTSNVLSNNWGGYVAGHKGVRFRYIKATFFVPYLDCASTPNSYSGHWVGLDGAGTPTVEQDGILAACNGTRPQYSAWYEMFPLPPVYSTMKVNPGNSIVATAYYDSHSRQYTLTVRDTTTGAQFTRVKACPAGSTCQRLSAEAISEAPSDGASILPLSNFRAESFSSVVVTSQTGRRGGLRAPGWNTLAVTTEGGAGHITDQPTEIAKGRAFDCYWMAAK